MNSFTPISPCLFLLLAHFSTRSAASASPTRFRLFGAFRRPEKMTSKNVSEIKEEGKDEKRSFRNLEIGKRHWVKNFPPCHFWSKRFYLTVRENFYPSSKSSRFVSLLSKNITSQRKRIAGLKMANFQLIV